MEGDVHHTISAGGFSAAVEAFARDPDSQGLWLLSMAGPQAALKAIWAALLKLPPDTAYLVQGTDGTGLSGDFMPCVIPQETIGTWTTKIARLPVSGGWHALVYTRLAEYHFSRDTFLLLARDREQAPELHYRFLDHRSPLPLHPAWKDWLWERGLEAGEITPLESSGILAYRCAANGEQLQADLSRAVASGKLRVPEEEERDG